MMAKLHDTVAVVEDTWIKCISDLGSYLTAIEEEGPRSDDTASCSLISSIQHALNSAVVGPQQVCDWEILTRIWDCYEVPKPANRERT